jgi:hypothetical protein
LFLYFSLSCEHFVAVQNFIFGVFFLKVVAVAVFLALGFAFYVFFAPFVGKKVFQYIVMGLYTPLVSHFFLSLSLSLSLSFSSTFFWWV